MLTESGDFPFPIHSFIRMIRELATAKVFGKSMFNLSFSAIICCFLILYIFIFQKSKTHAFKKHKLSNNVLKHLTNKHCFTLK